MKLRKLVRAVRVVVTTVAVSLACATASAELAFEQSDVNVKRKPSDEAWKAYATRTLAVASAEALPTVELSTFGGRMDVRYAATGFFRVERLGEGRFTLVDPEGYAFLSVGQCAVQPNPTERGKVRMAELFGDRVGWARATAALLKDTGFNTLACWSAWGTFRDAGVPMPYTTQLNLMSAYGKKRGGTYQKPGHTGYPDDCIFVFDPEFEAFAFEHAAKEIAAIKDDPWLLGHFSDNELPLWNGSLKRYLKLPEGDPGRAAAEQWWAERRGGSQREPDEADDHAFLGFACERYYRIASEAIRTADPNHLYLGSRLLNVSSRRDPVLRASVKYVDVLSVNYYYAWTPDAELLDRWVELTGRPFMITEWYAKGVDSGMGNASGAGWLVETQEDRGRFYENFSLKLLEHPGCVGWHWFKYIDNDPTNLQADPSNRDSNKGMVTNLYEPYEPLVERMTKINRHVYALRDALMPREP